MDVLRNISADGKGTYLFLPLLQLMNFCVDETEPRKYISSMCVCTYVQGTYPQHQETPGSVFWRKFIIHRFFSPQLSRILPSEAIRYAQREYYNMYIL